MKEPLQYYLDHNTEDFSSIQEIVYGEKYVAVMLKNGNIGVTATLGNQVNRVSGIFSPNIHNTGDRILFNAFLNARFNSENEYPEDKDIFDFINFKNYQDIVMVGYFAPLVKKFEKANIRIHIFDKQKSFEELLDMDRQMEYLGKADAVILSATTIFNESFSNICVKTRPGAEIFLLGPSAIMQKDMYQYPNIKKIFGMVFQKNDQRVLDVIEKGMGTQAFIPFAKKVYF